MTKRRTNLRFDGRVCALLGLVLLTLLPQACVRNQNIEPQKTITPSILDPLPTSIPNETTTHTPMPSTVSPTVPAFNPSGWLLFLNGNNITITDIGMRSSTELNVADAIYDQPVLTKDGNLYFLSDQGASQGMMEVYRTRSDGKSVERITQDDYFDFYLTSCYDQNFVAYVSDQHEVNGIFNIYLSGFQDSLKPRKIYSTTEKVAGLSCSPDGEHLAFFLESDKPGLGNLFMIDVNGENLLQLTQTNDVSTYSLSWSPDSQQIAIAVWSQHDDYLAIINTVGSITEVNSAETGLDVGGPLWSPDGKWILFEAFNKQAVRLKIIDPHGGLEQVLIDTPNSTGYFSYNATWSPDSKYVAFSMGNNNSNAPVDLYVLGLESMTTEKLLSEGLISITSLSWIPVMP